MTEPPCPSDLPMATKSVIDRGLLGQLHDAEVDSYHGIGPCYSGFSWYRTARGGVSNLLLAGCHALDVFLLYMGSDVEETFCYSTKSASAVFAPYEYPSISVVVFRYADGRLRKVASNVDCFEPFDAGFCVAGFYEPEERAIIELAWYCDEITAWAARTRPAPK